MKGCCTIPLPCPWATNAVTTALCQYNLKVLKMYKTDAPQLPTGPMHMLLDAAVGLFDVSGFSKIADRLEKEEAGAGKTV